MDRPMHPEADRPRPPLPPTVAGPPWRLATADGAVEFARTGDRWSHRVILAAADGGQAGPAIEWASVEGPLPPEDDPRWPASPALQNVTCVLAATGPALVGVGLSGRSHFSATVQPDPAVPRAFRFEIACRLHEEGGWLGSTYRSGGRIWRIVATPASGSLPRTVTWAYSLGPDGPFAAVDATISGVAAEAVEDATAARCR